RGATALEAALDVFRRQGRKNLAYCELLVPMAFAGYEISFEFARRVGDETISRLRRALGLGTLDAPVRFDSAEALAATLRQAPFLEEGEEVTPGAPDMEKLVSWLLHAAITLTSAASAGIDHGAEERYVAALEPFTLLGEGHPAAIAHEFC